MARQARRRTQARFTASRATFGLRWRSPRLLPKQKQATTTTRKRSAHPHRYEKPDPSKPLLRQAAFGQGIEAGPAPDVARQVRSQGVDPGHNRHLRPDRGLFVLGLYRCQIGAGRARISASQRIKLWNQNKK